MPTPSLVAVYVVHSAAADTTNLVTPSFTPANGELIIAKLATWDTANGMGALSGGGQTYTNRVTAAPGGFNAWARLDSAVISGSPGPMTITGAGSASASRHSMVVERWTNAQLAASPAVNSPLTGAVSLPQSNLTTVSPGSVASYVIADTQSVDPATRAYLNSDTEEGIWDGHLGSNGVFYFARATLGAAGAYTIGLSAPGGQRWVMAGIEIQGVATAPSQQGALAMFY